MYCKKCGAQVKETSRFCPKCGSELAGNVGIGEMKKTAVSTEDERNVSDQINSDTKNKKKRYILLIVVLLLIAAGIAGTIIVKKNEQRKFIYLVEAEWITDGNDNFIRSVRYENEKTEYGILSKNNFEERQYDLYGNLLSETWYEGDGETVSSREEYQYDTVGKLIISTSTWISYDDGRERKDITTYTYDAQGNVLNQTDYSDGELIWYTEYQYDISGNCLGYKWVDDKGLTILSVEYSHDSSGHILCETNSGTGEVIYDYIYENTEKGLSEKKYYRDGILKEENLYDDAGNILLYKGYDSFGSGEVAWWHEYTYDAQGKQLSWVRHDSDGEVLSKTEYTYDENGNMSTMTVWDAENGTEKTKYYYEKFEVMKLPTE